VSSVLGQRQQILYSKQANIYFCSTWRPLVPVLEDRPLALCDSRSVDPNDLIAADRILPDRKGEVYYLRRNVNQRW